MTASPFTPKINSKLPHVGTTIFTEMSTKAAAFNAINLGQGFPDFPMDAALTNLVNDAMQKGHNQYVHMNGLPALRERIAEKSEFLYGRNIDPETEICVTPGATYALFTAFATILQPGDEVILFEPAYDCYIPAIELNAAVPVPVSLSFPDYQIDWQEVSRKITDRTKAILINSPHNPTGKLLQEKDMQALTEIVKDKNIFVISDEVYEHLVFDDKAHVSVLSYPELYSRSFVCFSFGKTFHCTGWKTGYCVAPPELMKEFRKIHQYNAFTCFGPVQYALAEFLQHRENYLELGKQIQLKRDFFAAAMQQTAFKPILSEGSFFQLYSYADISNEKEYDFAQRLVKDYGVAAIPVSAFYSQPAENKMLQFCFIKKEETLQAAAERLMKIK